MAKKANRPRPTKASANDTQRNTQKSVRDVLNKPTPAPTEPRQRKRK